MSSRTETNFPYLGVTETITPHSFVDEANYNKAVKAVREFPKRLRIVREFQETLKTRDVLTKITKGKYKIDESESTKAYRPKTQPYPNPVVYDYEVLPVFTELAVPITRNVLDLTKKDGPSQTFQIGVRIEIPVEFQPEGKIQVTAGILNIPGARISNTFLRKHLLDESLMSDLRQRHSTYLKTLLKS